MTQMTSLEFNAVISAWGVNDERKLKAIGLLMNRIKPHEVLRLVDKMGLAENAVRKAQIELERTNKAFDDFCNENARG